MPTNVVVKRGDGLVEHRVGLKKFRDGLSSYLRLVRDGHSLILLDRGRPLARIVPAEASGDATAWRMVAQGLATWEGGKPSGLNPPIRLNEGPPVSELIANMRP